MAETDYRQPIVLIKRDRYIDEMVIRKYGLTELSEPQNKSKEIRRLKKTQSSKAKKQQSNTQVARTHILSKGNIVWGKLRGYPWWPARVN